MKAASPVRLQADLMDAATVAGDQEHRSATEQIEYWASLGRRIAQFVNPNALLEVASGLARIKIEPTTGQPIDPDTVFASIEARRLSGRLSQEVTTSPIRYQASVDQPGYLEQIDENGNRTVGTFKNGIFTPLDR